MTGKNLKDLYKNLLSPEKVSEARATISAYDKVEQAKHDQKRRETAPKMETAQPVMAPTPDPLVDSLEPKMETKTPWIVSTPAPPVEQLEMKIQRERIEGMTKLEMLRQEKLAGTEFEQYGRSQFSIYDLEGDEKSIQAKAELVKAGERYRSALQQIGQDRIQRKKDADARALLFSSPRTSNAEVFHVASQGYFIARDNGRVFISRDNGRDKSFYGLIKPSSADTAGNYDATQNFIAKVSDNEIITTSFYGSVDEIDVLDFAEIKKNKPSWEVLSRAYCLLKNNTLKIPTNKTTKIW